MPVSRRVHAAAACAHWYALAACGQDSLRAGQLQGKEYSRRTVATACLLSTCVPASCFFCPAESPIAHWLKPGGLMEDADSEIVVVVSAHLQSEVTILQFCSGSYRDDRQCHGAKLL